MFEFKIRFKSGAVGYFRAAEETIEDVELLATMLRKVMEGNASGSITMIDLADNKTTLINLQEIETIGYSLVE